MERSDWNFVVIMLCFFGGVALLIGLVVVLSIGWDRYFVFPKQLSAFNASTGCHLGSDAYWVGLNIYDTETCKISNDPKLLKIKEAR